MWSHVSGTSPPCHILSRALGLVPYSGPVPLDFPGSCRCPPHLSAGTRLCVRVPGFVYVMSSPQGLLPCFDEARSPVAFWKSEYIFQTFRVWKRFLPKLLLRKLRSFRFPFLFQVFLWLEKCGYSLSPVPRNSTPPQRICFSTDCDGMCRSWGQSHILYLWELPLFVLMRGLGCGV